MIRYICIIWLCMPSIVLADSNKVDKKDLYVREAFFLAKQGEYIDAISRLDFALGKVGGLGNPKSKSIYFHIGNKKITAGDFELSYRMFDRVKSTYEDVIKKNHYQEVRNAAMSQLAGIYMRGGEPKKALDRISTIEIQNAELSEEELYSLSQIYMMTGKYPEAVNLLRKLEKADRYQYFADYNLAIALLKSGRESEGFEQLDKLGKASGENKVDSALIDKANLLMGSLMLEKNQPVFAKQHFNRARLSGPYSNKALLGSGWADVLQNRYDQALVPWTVLSKRDVSDIYVQESLLGVPFAYAKLELPGRAHLQYSKAVEAYDSELSRLDASIQSVKDGKFMRNLFSMGVKKGRNWASNIQSVAATPETQYLSELLKFSDIQLSLDNYMDLNAMYRKVEAWEKYLDEKFLKSGQSASSGLAKAGKNVQQLRGRMKKSKQKTFAILSKQRKLLEAMVIDELKNRRKTVSEYRVQAGIGMIESYESANNQNVLPRGIE